MKKISICIPCYNEAENLEAMCQALADVMSKYQEKYQYEIIFADNCSTDCSREVLRALCQKDERIKAIFNTRNFGSSASNRNAVLSAGGDAVITMVCDLQEPPELIHQFIASWEQGSFITVGQKVTSQENTFKRFCRTLYYKIIKFFSDVSQFEHVTGFGLYDRKIIEEVRRFDDAGVSMRHIIAKLGFPVTLISFSQASRRAGKSSYNLFRYFDFAITSLISTSYYPLRLVTILGVLASIASFFIGTIYLCYKLLYWKQFELGMAPLIIGMFFLGSVQLLVLGMIGEYIVAISKRINKYSRVYELERINFEDETAEEKVCL